MAGDLPIKETWFRIERSLGLIDDSADSVDRSQAAIGRSRARLAATAPQRLERLFAARMDRASKTPQATSSLTQDRDGTANDGLST